MRCGFHDGITVFLERRKRTVREQGVYFVQALQGTNRNDLGIVDYEGITGLEGVGLANVVKNREEVVGWGEEKKLQTLMTYDDGSEGATSTRRGRSCRMCTRPR
jgi:hypothetical protein